MLRLVNSHRLRGLIKRAVSSIPCLHQTHSSLFQRKRVKFTVHLSKDEKMSSSEEGQVICCHSVQEWKENFQKGVDSKKLVVVDFTASWCGPCRFIGPILAEIAKKTPHVIFLKVDVDELKDVAREYEVEAMPTFLFIKDGKVVDKIVGARKEELQAKITSLGGQSAVTTSA